MLIMLLVAFIKLYLSEQSFFLYFWQTGAVVKGDKVGPSFSQAFHGIKLAKGPHHNPCYILHHAIVHHQ